MRHPAHVLFQFLFPILILQHMALSQQLRHPGPYLHKPSYKGLHTRKAACLNHIRYLSREHTLVLYRTYLPCNNLQTLPLSYQQVCLLSLTARNKPFHLHKTLQEAHKVLPSVPFYLTSQALQTSYCMRSRYCISQDGGTGQ